MNDSTPSTVAVTQLGAAADLSATLIRNRLMANPRALVVVDELPTDVVGRIQDRLNGWAAIGRLPTVGRTLLWMNQGSSRGTHRPLDGLAPRAGVDLLVTGGGFPGSWLPSHEVREALWVQVAQPNVIAPEALQNELQATPDTLMTVIRVEESATAAPSRVSVADKSLMLTAGRYLVVVPGHAKSGRITDTALSRLRVAERLVKTATPRAVLLSGWAGSYSASEALQLRRAWTIDEAPLLLDVASTITLENMAAAADYCSALGDVREVVVVTSRWHKARARLFAAMQLHRLGVQVRFVYSDDSVTWSARLDELRYLGHIPRNIRHMKAMYRDGLAKVGTAEENE